VIEDQIPHFRYHLDAGIATTRNDEGQRNHIVFSE
jgi:hypothetical protein